MGLYEIMCVKIENFKALLEFNEYFIQLKKKNKTLNKPIIYSQSFKT